MRQARGRWLGRPSRSVLQSRSALLSWATARTALLVPASAGNAFFVSVQGSDGNPGSLRNPGEPSPSGLRRSDPVTCSTSVEGPASSGPWSPPAERPLPYHDPVLFGRYRSDQLGSSGVPDRRQA
jgi:hypothetical protein